MDTPAPGRRAADVPRVDRSVRDDDAERKDKKKREREREREGDADQLMRPRRRGLGCACDTLLLPPSRTAAVRTWFWLVGWPRTHARPHGDVVGCGTRACVRAHGEVSDPLPAHVRVRWSLEAVVTRAQLCGPRALAAAFHPWPCYAYEAQEKTVGAVGLCLLARKYMGHNIYIVWPERKVSFFFAVWSYEI